MLTEQRHEIILNLLSKKRSITVTELKELLNTSESTIRRDLNTLDEQGKLTKVFGGAVEKNNGVSTTELSVSQKATVNTEEKKKIAMYAAKLVSPNDFIYIDAGTTTEYLIDYLEEKTATYVTNAVTHARKLAIAGFKVILIGGELKGITEAVVGNQASDSSRMFCIGNVSPEKKKLVDVTKECVELGLKEVKPWGFLGDMGQAVHDHAFANGYTVVREIGGHGVGLEFHEEPWVG